jgi:hypothetical protein
MAWEWVMDRRVVSAVGRDGKGSPRGPVLGGSLREMRTNIGATIEGPHSGWGKIHTWTV